MPRKALPDSSPPVPRSGLKPAAAAAVPGDSFVQAFARGLRVIQAFDGRARALTLTEVAEGAGVTRAGARRILLTLEHLGYVRLDGRAFSLTARILSLGYPYLTSLPFWNFAEPVMEELVQQIHESCSAAVLDGGEIVYVLRVPTQKIMAINLSIGSRLPAYCTSMGRVLLAGLNPMEANHVLRQVDLKALTSRTETRITRLKAIVDDTRTKGWALVDQELEEGLISLAVPIVGASGRTIAAMNIGGQANRTPAVEMKRRFLAPLQSAAQRISTMMAGHGKG
ncbi:MAG: IclR family transcriptional regulator C-terminal domain-containing protein [Burkholderiaceae bacterium]